MASKLELLQEALRIGSVKFSLIVNVFHHRGLHGAGKNQKEVPEDVVREIFDSASKVNNVEQNVMHVDIA